MTRARLPARLGAALLVLGALVACVGGALLPASTARSAPALQFVLDFGRLDPGATATRTGEAALARDATLVAFSWVERDGVLVDAVLDVDVCGAGVACAPVSSAVGSAFGAGRVSVTVTARLADDVDPGGEGTAIGVLTFQADDLAPTGPDPLGCLLLGGILLTVGAGLALVSGRPRPS
ncbi:hypothetical protein [Protaetiibacter mangrovi]|uniref:LPXTG cell wall anchor domain-containing protein n=1 Tax=Protaetiibacter mangrovi TaxID=2970926 RepID=A0ABT1ZJ18_9MICO|nr:hypothetical protein [Protaetiibacter mangrovi]MCS0500707.1 hypothetical protein [Protaetiibacter mangrovi]TPW91047.1 hypothetical protein FJ656_36250 [Schumannella luteola]